MSTSGRYAMLDEGMGFSLLPWRSVIEQRLGQRHRHRLLGDHWLLKRRIPVLRDGV